VCCTASTFLRTFRPQSHVRTLCVIFFLWCKEAQQGQRAQRGRRHTAAAGQGGLWRWPRLGMGALVQWCKANQYKDRAADLTFLQPLFSVIVSLTLIQ